MLEHLGLSRKSIEVEGAAVKAEVAEPEPLNAPQRPVPSGIPLSSLNPDADGDGICDSEDDDDGTTTLGARLIEIIYQPVMMWMLVVGVVASLIMGMTATTIALRRDREPTLYDATRSSTSAIERDNHAWEGPSSGNFSPSSPVPVPSPAKNRVEELVDQGYSPEVAKAISESED